MTYLHTNPAPVEDSLRTRIAAVIESIRIQRDGDTARMADAVIRELNLATACESGCVWQIPNRVEDMTDTQKQLLKIAVPPSWGTPSFDNGRHND